MKTPNAYVLHKGVGVVAIPHGVLLRDSHYMVPTLGGVHKIQILIKDLLKECLQKKKWGGQGDPDPLIVLRQKKEEA